ncbi:MAG: hypothetical protein V9H69_07685 [Anaerolineae bacterium]
MRTGRPSAAASVADQPRRGGRGRPRGWPLVGHGDGGEGLIIVAIAAHDAQAQGVGAIGEAGAVELGQAAGGGRCGFADGQEIGLSRVASRQQVKLPFGEVRALGHAAHSHEAAHLSARRRGRDAA